MTDVVLLLDGPADGVRVSIKREQPYIVMREPVQFSFTYNPCAGPIFPKEHVYHVHKLRGDKRIHFVATRDNMPDGDHLIEMLINGYRKTSS